MRALTPERIEEVVASVYGVGVPEMRSASRQRRVTEPRQVAMYLQKTLLDLPYTQIGLRFGGRDHSTVIHSIQKVSDAVASDPNFHAKLDEVRSKLR
jgi:chromosomal replication initiator protein